MQIYLTGAPKEGHSQPDPDQSLGGYVSGSSIQNGVLGNLFGDVSTLSLERAISEYRAIALYNETESVVVNLSIWIESPESPIGSYSIGIVALSQDDCGAFMELLPNKHSMPFSVVEFNTAQEEVNAISLPDMESKSYLGIFVRRQTQKSSKSCSSLYQKYVDETSADGEESHTIIFDFQ